MTPRDLGLPAVPVRQYSDSLLVNQLDRITDILEKADSPRYFLLDMPGTKRKDEMETFTNLREVGERLAG